MERKKVLVYYTGGTIGMTAETPRRADPHFQDRMVRELADVGGLPEWTFARAPELLDSSNMTPANWVTRLFPGISGEITKNFLRPPLEGAVLHAYGSGNGPSRETNKPFRDALKNAVDRGVVIVACTQCLRGSVDLSLYQTGLGREGVISGYDMTAEAAVTKLFWLLSRGLERSEVKRQMQLNLRGELTLPTRPRPCP